MTDKRELGALGPGPSAADLTPEDRALIKRGGRVGFELKGGRWLKYTLQPGQKTARYVGAATKQRAARGRPAPQPAPPARRPPNTRESTADVLGRARAFLASAELDDLRRRTR